MVSAEALAGYLLEEVLAKLIESAGYRLLTHHRQDPAELTTNSAGDLLVRGRGGNHQVDVLGEFDIVPAFGQPLRLFVEAKARQRKTGLPVVRNAYGTVHDVNQAWMISYSKNRIRHQYVYALFSTSGFSRPAQDYAIAHQISLIDLSGPEWQDLRDIVAEVADDLLMGVPRHVERFPVRQLRQVARSMLGTEPSGESNPVRPSSDMWLVPGIQRLNGGMDVILAGALLIFPVGGQALLARPNNLQAFVDYAIRHPRHQVTVTPGPLWRGSSARSWIVAPIDAADSYRLTVALPVAIENRALQEGDRRQQAQVAVDQLGGRLDVLWDPRGGDVGRRSGPHTFRLEFSSHEVRQRRLQT